MNTTTLYPCPDCGSRGPDPDDCVRCLHRPSRLTVQERARKRRDVSRAKTEVHTRRERVIALPKFDARLLLG